MKKKRKHIAKTIRPMIIPPPNPGDVISINGAEYEVQQIDREFRGRIKEQLTMVRYIET